MQAHSRFLEINPAPGDRLHNSGALFYIGNYGFSYSSSELGNNGMFLCFNMTSLNPSDATRRAYGLQLRCLSE